MKDKQIRSLFLSLPKYIKAAVLIRLGFWCFRKVYDPELEFVLRVKNGKPQCLKTYFGSFGAFIADARNLKIETYE